MGRSARVWRRDRSFLISASKHYVVPAGSAELADAQAIAWAAIGMYPVGVIVLCAALLYGCRHTLLLGEASTPYSRSVSFLHNPFSPTYFYFDILEMTKKLLLVGFASYPRRASNP